MPIQKNTALILDLKKMIQESKQQVAVQVNSAMTMMYWHIGNRINKEILQDKRAEYGKEVVKNIAQELTQEFGKSFAEKNLRRMMRFSFVFSDIEIVSPLVRQLSWSHFLYLIPIEDDLKRTFYTEMSRLENWSKRTLKSKIDFYKLQKINIE